MNSVEFFWYLAATVSVLLLPYYPNMQWQADFWTPIMPSTCSFNSNVEGKYDLSLYNRFKSHVLSSEMQYAQDPNLLCRFLFSWWSPLDAAVWSLCHLSSCLLAWLFFLLPPAQTHTVFGNLFHQFLKHKSVL